MTIRYEIDSDAVRIYDQYETCFIHQPFHPDGRDWDGTTEMENWAKEFVENFGK